MRAFHAEAELSIEKLRLQLAAAQEQFAQLAAYVNGAAKTSVSEPQAFFAMLLTFARDLDSAHMDNLAADEQVSSQSPAQPQMHRSRLAFKGVYSGNLYHLFDGHVLTSTQESGSASASVTLGGDTLCKGRGTYLQQQLCHNAFDVLQSRKRAKKAAAAKGGAPQGGALKQRDRMLSQVKAYQRLRPEDRRALLTDKVCHCR